MLHGQTPTDRAPSTDAHAGARLMLISHLGHAQGQPHPQGPPILRRLLLDEGVDYETLDKSTKYNPGSFKGLG